MEKEALNFIHLSINPHLKSTKKFEVACQTNLIPELIERKRKARNFSSVFEPGQILRNTEVHGNFQQKVSIIKENYASRKNSIVMSSFRDTEIAQNKE